MPVEAERRFRQEVRGVVRTDRTTRGAYATDASMYQFMPLAVVEPLDRDDLLSAIRICRDHRLPLLPRGGGTSLTGQTVGHSVVIDVSRFCHRLLELNPEERWARVEPGITRDALNRAAAPHGLHFAPDPATSSRANLGGMIANNAAGMRSLRYGMTIDHLLEVEMGLSTGEVVRLSTLDEEPGPAAESDAFARIARGLRAIVERERTEIATRYPKVPRRSGGYALDAFLQPLPWNLARIVAGSEGTLGFILEARVRLEPIPRHSALCLAHFRRLADGLRAVPAIVPHGPSAVELLDGLILRQARSHPLTSAACRCVKGDPEALLIIEARADDPREVDAVLAGVQEALRAGGTADHAPVVTDPHEVQRVWQMRESALGLMTTVKGPRKPVPYIEDAAVPVESLQAYVEDVLAICRRHGQPVSLFAHAGAGLLHIRPLHDLHQRREVEEMLQIQEEVFARVLHYGGAWSGEHGDGIVRGGFNRRLFGDRLYEAFRELKALFDPAGLMNPGKIVDAPPPDQNLRYSADAAPVPVRTAFRWREEEGLLRAAEQCTGIGACRKLSSGVMCPSYMATRDEVHSTRGRANVLRLALTGQLGAEALHGEALRAIFDLCLACKGCRGECPNAVDVGKMKAELQHQYYKTHRRPLRAHLLARVQTVGALRTGPLGPLVQALLEARGVRRALDRWFGLDARRALPPRAGERFSAWFRRHVAERGPRFDAPRVLLFGDPYLEYHEPGVGRAAVGLLEAAGYEADLFTPADSLRPTLSQGLLDRARREGLGLFRRLSASGAGSAPVLVLEPSCATALLQDLPDLIEDEGLIAQVLPRVAPFEEFLWKQVEAGRARLAWPAPARPLEALFHPHCHQRALDSGRATLALLHETGAITVRESGAGCCGLAGAFGYEKEHYDFSVAVAEDRLLPAVRKCDAATRIVAPGFSCRQQIRELTGRAAMHPVELLHECLVAPW